MPPPRRVLLAATSVALGLAVSLALAEAALRLRGHAPWRPAPPRAGEPVVHRPDPVLGWTGLPGRHVLPPFAEGGPEVRMTLLADGRRASGGTTDPEAPALVLLGGSFVQGWALSDEDTLAWRLAERFPRWRVVNLGTAGYGTYQSLLALERLLAGGERVDTVVYGLIGDHEQRNVANPVWLFALSSHAPRGLVAVPWVGLDAGGRLERHPPTSRPRWPGHAQLALVPALEKVFALRGGRARVAAAPTVLRELLAELRRVARAHDARLLVALLQASPAQRERYRETLAALGIDAADCAERIPRSQRVPGDAHPGPAVNARWADCVGAALARPGAAP